MQNISVRSLPKNLLQKREASALQCISAHSSSQSVGLTHEVLRAVESGCGRTFVTALKDCSHAEDVAQGKLLHMHIIRCGLEMDPYVENTLIDLYAKCGCLDDACCVFDRTIRHDLIGWNTLISGFAQHGQGQLALQFFGNMHQVHMVPSRITFVCILKACSAIRAVEDGRIIHAYIVENSMEANVSIGNSLIDMYAKCKSTRNAETVFDMLSNRDIVTWSTMMSCLCEQGHGKEALHLFEKMQCQGITPTHATYFCALKACTTIPSLEKGMIIHVQIVEDGFEVVVSIGNTLIDMYAKYGSLADAHRVLDSMCDRNVVSWNALIAGYVNHEPREEALCCFHQMQNEGVPIDAVTCTFILKACHFMGVMCTGMEIHDRIVKIGLEQDVFVGSSLISMYAKCGSLTEAWKIFEKLQGRDVVSWTTLLSGCAEHGAGKEALKYFEQMRQEGISPTAYVYACSFKACASVGMIHKGREIHLEVVKRGCEDDVYVGSSLVDMYAKSGFLLEAQEAFDELPVRSIVPWNALITGYAEHGPCQKALACFEQMRREKVHPNSITYACISKACGSLGAIEMGRDVHIQILKIGLDANIFVSSSLVGMYVKCGSLSEGSNIFKKMPFRNAISWNSMIKAFGVNQDGNMAVKYFEDMQEQGVLPDARTFVCLLMACSRAKMFSKSHEFLKLMRDRFGIVPSSEHLTCMVDLFARSGFLSEAEKFLESLPSSPSRDMLTAFLTSCGIHEEGELGLKCFRQLMEINSKQAAPYVLMANTFATCSGNLQDKASKQCAGMKSMLASSS
eukprot:c25097_g8_i1 orf=233-2614(+)